MKDLLRNGLVCENELRGKTWEEYCCHKDAKYFEEKRLKANAV